MITMAIAVKEPVATRRYRHLLSQSGFETHFVSTIEELIRTVKARPVDVVLFDLGPLAVSPVEWLAAANKDKDLEFTPVLWVGDKVANALQPVIADYRPGIWLKSIPLSDELMSTVLRLIGRKTDDTSAEDQPIKSEKVWVPEENTIEDALQIFDEEEKMGKPAPANRGRSDPGHRPAARTGAPPRAASAPTGRVGARASRGDDRIEIDATEMGRSGRIPVATAQKYSHLRDAHANPAPPRKSSAKESAALGTLSEEDIRRITLLVVDRLAATLPTEIDRDVVRRVIEAALHDSNI